MCTGLEWQWVAKSVHDELINWRHSSLYFCRTQKKSFWWTLIIKQHWTQLTSIQKPIIVSVKPHARCTLIPLILSWVSCTSSPKSIRHPTFSHYIHSHKAQVSSLRPRPSFPVQVVRCQSALILQTPITDGPFSLESDFYRVSVAASATIASQWCVINFTADTLKARLTPTSPRTDRPHKHTHTLPSCPLPISHWPAAPPHRRLMGEIVLRMEREVPLSWCQTS